MTAVAGFRFLRLRRNVIGVLLGLLACSMPLHAATITVTSAADADALDGGCTLREAITAINNGVDYSDCTHSGAAFGSGDTIAFNISGAGVQVIQPGTTLPVVLNPVLIDGYSQPGAAVNTNAGIDYPNIEPTNAVIRIELDGSLLPGGFGLAISGNGSVIRGLAIANFDRSGIGVLGANSLIVGNFVGVHADGTTAGGNGSASNSNTAGINLHQTTGVHVGSATVAADRNLIAGNQLFDVLVSPGSSANVIAGNLIGTDRTGAVALSPAFGVVVGGLGDEVERNLIAGCAMVGLGLVGAQTASVHGNAIGIGVGLVPLGNGTGTAGIMIAESSAGPALSNRLYQNHIAHNSGDGIVVAASSANASSGNRLDGNWIWGNSGLGINLQPDGEADFTVTANDPPAALDGDGGPNNLQNFPVAISATVNGAGGVDIAYTLASSPASNFVVTAYANGGCDGSGYGEGQYPANATASVSTYASGVASGTLSVPAGTPGWTGLGQYVTLLATNSGTNDTSEFSACVPVTNAAVVSGLTPTAVPTLSEWALILLGMLVVLATLAFRTREAIQSSGSDSWSVADSADSER